MTSKAGSRPKIHRIPNSGIKITLTFFKSTKISLMGTIRGLIEHTFLARNLISVADSIASR